jgi:hypothetical protein
MTQPEEAWDEMDSPWPPNPEASKIKVSDRLRKLLDEAAEHRCLPPPRRRPPGTSTR